MKLSDLNPEDVTSVSKAQPTSTPTGGLKLSDIHPDDIQKVDPSILDKLMGSAKSFGNSVSNGIQDFSVGGTQGATLGWGDEAVGGTQALGDKLSESLGLSPKSGMSLPQLARLRQQQNQKVAEDAEKRSPILYNTGSVLGGLIPAVAASGITGGGSDAIELTNAQKLLAALKNGATVGAPIGAIAGAGGSKATIEGNPGDLAKDAGFGAGIGLLAPAALTSAGMAKNGTGNFGLNAISRTIKDSPILQDMLNTYKYNKSGAQSFFGKAAGPQISNQIDDTVSNVANQFMQPIKDSSKMYGQALQDAADNGASLSTTNGDLNNALSAAKNVLGSAKTGDAAEALGMLEKQGKQVFNPETVSYDTTALNPQEAKILQLKLRKLASGRQGAEQDALNAAAKALNTGIDQALPEGTLADINSKFGQARDVAAPLINRGEIDPDFQTKGIGDIDAEQLPGKMKSYLKTLLPKTEATNQQGDNAKATWDNILQSTKDANNKAQTQFVNPDDIAGQVKDMATKANLRKQAVGVDSSSNISIPGGGLLQGITSSPLRAAEWAGKASNLISPITKTVGNVAESTGLPAMGRNLYQAGDDVLKSAAQRLEEAGHGDIANGLSSALENKSSNGKNAALFTIMQNPVYRQTVFGKDDSENDNNTNSFSNK